MLERYCNKSTTGRDLVVDKSMPQSSIFAAKCRFADAFGPALQGLAAFYSTSVAQQACFDDLKGHGAGKPLGRMETARHGRSGWWCSQG